MKCLILASGQGLRLKTKGDSKPLAPLLGLSLIERVILTAQKAGLTDFYVVIGYNGNKVKKHLKNFSQTRNINITTIDNDDWKKENDISVLKAKDFIKENFILLMSDHIFDESILIKLKGQKITDDEIMLAVDYNIKNNEFVDVDDVTKVNVKNNNIVDIGKNIDKYNAYDSGIFLCSPAFFDAIEESSQKGDSSLSGGIRILANGKKAKTLDIQNSFWIDVDDEDAFKKAESRLCFNLKKESDGPVSRYFNRPISINISKYLLKTRISPNFISLFTFIIATLGAFFFFLGGYVNLVIGGILAQFSSIIDGCEGEIARLKFQTTGFGGWFDAVLDRYADGFLLFGLTYYVYFINNNFLYIAIGFLAIIGTIMTSYTADKYNHFMKIRLHSYFGITRDVRMLIIFLGALLNQPLLILILIAALTNMEVVRRIVVLNKDEKSSLSKKED